MPDNELLSVDDGVSKIVDADASLVAKEYYTSYAKYVLEYRALPGVYDGLKPVQRRIIYIANQQPRKLMKTAKLSGLVLSLHPHGSSSVTGAINNMAYPLNNLPLFTTKGNFGSVNAPPSADRYTECYLSEIARMNFCQFVDYAEYEVGEIGELEPSYLPSLIPYCLLEGCEGIAIGLSTKVLPLNLLDLIDYYIDFIKKGSSSRKVKPDLGYVLLENDEIDKDSKSIKSRITTSSIVTQISDTSFLVEGLYGKSLDAVVSKIDKWDKSFTKGQVGYRDASSTSLKYVFEIYDDKYPSPQDFKENLIWATRCNSTFTRVVEEDGSAVSATLDYVVRKSLEGLNKAIDKKIKSELTRSQHQLSLYEVLNECKSQGVFNDIVQMTSDELVNLIIRSTSCSEDLAREIVKKPISYLTKSHRNEEDALRDTIDSLKNHDRTKYLISLYKEFRKAVLPIYESRKHSVSKDEVLNNPCIKIDGDIIKVADKDGEPFTNTVYFISDKGYLYRRTISALSSSEIVVETEHDDRIVGLVTDNSDYLSVKTKFSYEGWYGLSVFNISSLSYDKKIVNLRDEEGSDEKIVLVEGYSRLPDDLSGYLKNKLSKTTYVKEVN